MNFLIPKQLKLIVFSIFLLIIQLGVFDYLPYLRVVNLALLAVVSFSYFGERKLNFVLPILILGVCLDFWGASFQWGVYSLTLLLVFFCGAYLKNLFLRKENLATFLFFFVLFYFILALGYQIQNYLLFENKFFQADYQNYLRVLLINLPWALIFYYGNIFTSHSRKQGNKG